MTWRSRPALNVLLAANLMSGIHLFSAHYRPSVTRPPVDLLCQAVDIKGEKLLWTDGLMFEHPMLVPISAVGAVAYRGSFQDFLREHLSLAQEVLDVDKGQSSPTIIARAVLYMSRDPGLSAEEAIDLVKEEALDLIDADALDARAFSVGAKEAGLVAA